MPTEQLSRPIRHSHHWLDKIQEDLHYPGDQSAYVAMRAVLHALRDCLPPEESVKFSSSLPMMIRSIYYEGWKPLIKRIEVRTREEFLNLVRRSLREDMDALAVSRSIFRVLNMEV